jgi:hypothetical protein
MRYDLFSSQIHDYQPLANSFFADTIIQIVKSDIFQMITKGLLCFVFQSKLSLSELNKTFDEQMVKLKNDFRELLNLISESLLRLDRHIRSPERILVKSAYTKKIQILP